MTALPEGQVPLVCALLLDMDDAVDFPGNEGTVLGRPLATYPLMAARSSSYARRIYAVTNCPAVKAAALQYDAVIIDPPAGAAAPAVRDCLLHGYRQIVEDLRQENAAPELLVLLFANAPAVTRDMVDTGVEALLDRPELDSALSVAAPERWSPALAQRQNPDGLLTQFFPAASPALPEGQAWYPTWGVMVLRPRILETLPSQGTMPWLGRKVLPIKQWGGGLIDFHWQLPGLEYWLKKNGLPDLSPNMERQPLPKAQLSPKGDRR